VPQQKPAAVCTSCPLFVMSCIIDPRNKPRLSRSFEIFSWATSVLAWFTTRLAPFPLWEDRTLNMQEISYPDKTRYTMDPGSPCRPTSSLRLPSLLGGTSLASQQRVHMSFCQMARRKEGLVLPFIFFLFSRFGFLRRDNLKEICTSYCLRRKPQYICHNQVATH
jgi:hypothetical protein